MSLGARLGLGGFVVATLGVLLWAAVGASASGKGTPDPAGQGASAAMTFPEDRDWLGDAGLAHYKDYAKYLRPNVGIPESELGMSMKEFREIERKIRDAVLKEPTKAVLDKIKKDKYGITTTPNGAIVAPQLFNGSDFSKWFRALPEDQQVISKKEFENLKKVPSTISQDVGNYVLSITDRVLSETGHPGSVAKLLRAKAFVAGAYYFTREAVAYEPIQSTFGPPSRILTDKIESCSAFVLDRPRGVCLEQNLAFVSIVQSKTVALSISPSYSLVETSSKDRSKNYFLGLDHGVAMVHYNSQFLEGHDVTFGFSIDSQDLDSAARWITGRNGYAAKAPFNLSIPLSRLMRDQGDPISTMPRSQFQALDKNISRQVRDAVK